jgi:pimeloyl-ACP methyl ester carboxylesterase
LEVNPHPGAYNIGMPIERIKDTSLFYLEQGKGIPLVLVHGFPLDQRVWQAQRADLARICRVITPDLRGFGQSAAGGAFSIESLADDLRELLNRIGALPCVLGGLSMGGYVSLAFAKTYAKDLRGLILTDTRAEADTPQGRIGRDAMIELARTKGSVAVAEQMLPKMLADFAHSAEVRKIMESCPAETIQHACAAMRDRADYTNFLPQISVPTLIIVGESDVITPPNLAQAMHRAIPSSTLATIIGAGHLSPVERPGDVSRTIEEFLKTLTK